MSQGHPAYSKRIPVHGVIVWGAMHGWAYAFIRFQERRGELVPVVRATPPGWPFPQEVVLPPGTYGRLQSIKGVRTPTVPVALAKRQARNNPTENQPWLK